MKKILIFACVLAVTGCASGVKKRFTVIVDPPDARISVNEGNGGSEKEYHSPADITVHIPSDPVKAAKGRLAVSRDKYKTIAIALNSIQAQTIRLKLEKALHYRLKLRMKVGRMTSETLMYQDRILAIKLVPGERRFHVKIENLGDKPLNVLWEKAEYADISNRPHRIVHADVKPDQRRNAVPPESIPAKGSLEENFITEDSIVYSPQKKAFESEPLFVLDENSALALKGKNFSIFLPVELDRAIIPDYYFEFEIIDVVKD